MTYPQRKQELDPWRVIFSFLPDLTSDDITLIVGRTGLPVDWALNKQESYSHKTRIRAYIPRIIEAYSKLGDDEKLRVAWIITKEITDIRQDIAQRMNDALRVIGWKIETNKLKPDGEEVRELFFPKGATHDAYIEIKKVLNLATKTISIIDPYLDGTIFQMVKTNQQSVLSVKLLSAKLPPDFTLEANKFKSQHPSISVEIRKTKEFHDRFIIIDNKTCFHIGASIKDAGGKAFMISPIEDEENNDALLLQHKQSWASASQVTL
jgi:hypothetical protein